MNVTVEDCKDQALLHGANVFEISGSDKTDCAVYKCHPDFINYTETSTNSDIYSVGMYYYSNALP